MFKQTAIAQTVLTMGLAIATGSAFAAGATTGNSMGAEASTSAGATGAGVSGQSSLAAKFHRLDTNGDGVLSRKEAHANPTVAKLYESMNTAESIASDPKAKKTDANPQGVTLDQFVAGMQAASGGTAGPAVSGGQTYTVMKDGSKRHMKKSGQHMQHKLQHGAHKATQGMQRGMNDMTSGLNGQATSPQNGVQAGGNAQLGTPSQMSNGSTATQGNGMTNTMTGN